VIFGRSAVLLAGVVGLAIRLSYTISSDFPLHDGGLFALMARELRENAFTLPATTAYNGLDIPFVYPPLGLYVGAALSLLPGVAITSLMRWVPLIFSAATIFAFAYLARVLLPPFPAIAATFAFALTPASFAWLIMGGGLTRGPGMLFGLLALATLARFLSEPTRRRLVAGAAFGGLTLLAHPAAALFTGISALILVARARPPAATLRGSLLMMAGWVLVAAPWWITVLGRHGVSPLLASAGAGSSQADELFLLIRWNAWGEPLFPILASFGLLGVLISLARRQFSFVAWLATASFAPIAFIGSAVPLALLAGVGIDQARHVDIASRAARRIAVGALSYAALAAALASHGELVGLSPQERAAMSWVSERTPESARFLVVSGQPWGLDRTGEWFPTLAARPSVATPQGTEWLAGGLARRRVLAGRAQVCSVRDSACVEALRGDAFFDYVYLPGLRSRFDAFPTPCCPVLSDSLRRDPRYDLVYEAPGALIFRRS
jgi:hypothetical protein